MLMTTHRHETIVADLKAAHEAHLRAERQRIAETHQHAAQWRAACLEAQRALVELQRRHAPPEPIVGEVEQPPSVLDADAKVYEALRQQREATI